MKLYTVNVLYCIALIRPFFNREQYATVAPFLIQPTLRK